MGARVEIRKKYVRASGKASKKDKDQILDQVCAVTDWQRDDACQRLASTEQR